MALDLLAEIDTRACRWVARGQLRDIFEHPELPSALLKVIRTDRADPQGYVIGWSRQKLFAQRGFGIYVTFLRELRETLRAARHLHGRPDVPLPFARPLGLAKTERGVALIVERVSAPDGSLAPSVKQLIKEGRFTPAHMRALDRFFDTCAQRHMVFGDLNPGNLVLSGERFLAIDGIGEKTLLPIHEWSRRINARKLRRMQRRLHVYVERRSDVRKSPEKPRSA